MASDTALVAGATGLVGKLCLETLLECGYYQQVIALARRPLDRRHPRLTEMIVDFDKLQEIDPFPAGDVFCALGTTIRRAGSQAAFMKVDFEYPRTIASRSATAGSKIFVLVSSVSADPRSPNFYLRVKGELENAIIALPFESTHIFRPSFLIGERAETRLGESIAAAIARPLRFTMVGPLRKYRPMPAATLARAMAAATRESAPGRHIHHYDEILALAGRL